MNDLSTVPLLSIKFAYVLGKVFYYPLYQKVFELVWNCWKTIGNPCKLMSDLYMAQVDLDVLCTALVTLAIAVTAGKAKIRNG